MPWVCWFSNALFKWEALAALGTWAAVAAVWFQLKSIARQVELQAKQLELQTYAEYTKRYGAIVFSLPEDINSNRFKLNKRRSDYAQVMRNMRAYFDLCFEEWDLNRRKLIDLNAWKVWEGGMKTAFGKSAFQQAWKIIKDSNTEYGSEFESFVTACFVPR